MRVRPAIRIDTSVIESMRGVFTGAASKRNRFVSQIRGFRGGLCHGALFLLGHRGIERPGPKAGAGPLNSSD